jgi:hypothetical protein
MQESVEDIAVAVGGAIVAPGIGSAELVVALLVALAFVASAVLTFLPRRGEETDWRPHRS